jgi:hypothetical protein
MEVRQKTQWDGFRLTSDDGKHICQWKRNCLVFSRLQPYVSWAQYHGYGLAILGALSENRRSTAH